MNEWQRARYTVYTTEAAIPAYQRAWIWGTVALVILLCGIAAGWLWGGLLPDFRSDVVSKEPSRAIDSTELLNRQQATNERLRAHVVRVEQALAGDVCGSEALEVLTRDRPNP